MNIRTLNKRIAPAVATDDKGSAQIDVDAPDGFVCAGIGIHWRSYDYDADGWNMAPTRQEVYEWIFEDWGDGVEPCETEDCGVCNTEGESNGE